jgi:hypothetical protein
VKASFYRTHGKFLVRLLAQTAGEAQAEALAALRAELAPVLAHGCGRSAAVTSGDAAAGAEPGSPNANPLDEATAAAGMCEDCRRVLVERATAAGVRAAQIKSTLQQAPDGAEKPAAVRLITSQLLDRARASGQLLNVKYEGNVARGSFQTGRCAPWLAQQNGGHGGISDSV